MQLGQARFLLDQLQNRTIEKEGLLAVKHGAGGAVVLCIYFSKAGATSVVFFIHFQSSPSLSFLFLSLSLSFPQFYQASLSRFSAPRADLLCCWLIR